MRLFWRDQTPLIFIYVVQLLLSSLVFWLNDPHNLSIILYSNLLSSLLFGGYLCYRYLSLKLFYHRLSTPLNSLDDSIQRSGHAPAAEALDTLLQVQFQQFQHHILRYKNKLEDHVLFINQWVHNMKTPLSVIQLSIQDKDDPLYHSIQEELDRLHKGLQMVIYTSRLEQFEHDFHVESIQLQNLVKKVISENKRLFIRNRIYPEIRIDDNIKIHSDEKWLSFIFDQLIINAVRYSDGPDKKVTITSFKQDEQTILEVKDEGIGISQQDIRRVFEPYYTGKHGRKYRESTGMGLYLVKEISNKLGHHIELDSKEGVGTMVRILFSSCSSLTKM